ncbi:MAG: hypothetical protein JWN65_2331 [Solirubrobacterales bacterium]|jgi:hypothetical protein|nr:hypothetical protein [Solirubrobacterales bacterium]
MPTEPAPVTLFDVASRAVAVCDQSGVDSDLGEFLERFEDADVPIGDPVAVRERIYEEVGALDPQEEDGPIQLATAIAVYLCFRRDQLDDPPAKLIRLAVAAEFHDQLPDVVEEFLMESGVEY